MVRERQTRERRELLRRDPAIVTWWGSAVECVSALQQLHREGSLDIDRLSAVLHALALTAAGWTEVRPSDRLRRRAQRLLGVHALRAADALQLAAAITAAEEDPRRMAFACGDVRLSEAARREGFTVR